MELYDPLHPMIKSDQCSNKILYNLLDNKYSESIESLSEEIKSIKETNNSILDKIYLKYEKDLRNFEYIKNENIQNISIGNKILYINKNSFLKKSGTLYKILSNDIFQICNQNRSKKWFIYTNEYIFFNKIRTNNLLRNKLQNLINNDFNFKKDENIIENSVYIYKK